MVFPKFVYLKLPSVNTIIDRLVEHASTFPDKIAFTFLENGENIEVQLSYEQLFQKTQRMATAISKKNVFGQRIALFYQDPLEFIIAFLACQYAGAVAVPMPFTKHDRHFDKLIHIIKDVDPHYFLCSEVSVKTLKSGLKAMDIDQSAEILNGDEVVINCAESSPCLPVMHPIAFIQYTSGSTNDPKGVVISSTNLMANQIMLESTFETNQDSIILSWLPFYHDMGLIGSILHSVFIGCHCILFSPLQFVQKPSRWLKAISKYHVTHSGGPNFAFDHCLNKISADELSDIDLSSWTVAYNGAEPISAETIKQFSARFINNNFRMASFYPCYGLAEGTLLVSGVRKKQIAPKIIKLGSQSNDSVFFHKAASSQTEFVSCGKQPAGIEIILLSPQNKRCKKTETGEICIAGESVSEGYWKKDNDQLYWKDGKKRYLRTGDIGAFHGRELVVLGRLKESIIIRGKNFFPYDIEDTIAKTIDIAEKHGVAIFSLSTDPQSVIVIVEVKRNKYQNIAESVIHSIDNAISGLCGITTFDIVLTLPGSIPRTTSGKLKRLACSEHYANGAFKILISKRDIRFDLNGNKSQLIDEVFKQPNTQSIQNYLNEVLTAVCQKQIRSEQSYHTPLTFLGLDSLKGVELINLINNDFNVNLDVSTLLHDTSLADLGELIESIVWLKQSEEKDGGVIL